MSVSYTSIYAASAMHSNSLMYEGALRWIALKVRVEPYR